MNLVAAIVEGRVLAVGAPFIADFRKALRLYGQAEQLALVGRERGGQRVALEVFGDQRVVGATQAECEREVERGRGLAAARHADQDDIGFGEVLVGLPVVVRQAEIDGLDAVGVFLLVLRGTVRAADGVCGLQAQFLFERLDEGLEKIQHQAIRGVDHLAGFAVDQRIEDDGFESVVRMRSVDAQHAHLRLLHRVDEGHAGRLGRQPLELRQQRLAKRLGGDAGTVGDEEHAAFWGVGVGHWLWRFSS